MPLSVFNSRSISPAINSKGHPLVWMALVVIYSVTWLHTAMLAAQPILAETVGENHCKADERQHK